MKVFAYEDYKQLILDRFQESPAKGRGEFQKLAAALALQPSMISQILRGKRDLSVDQACLAAKFLGLSDAETEFFVDLVQFKRAQTGELKRLLGRRLETLRERAASGASPSAPSPDRRNQAIYYSQWLYSAVRILTSIESTRTVPAIAHRLGEPPHVVRRVVDFLLEAGFCLEETDAQGNARLRPATLETRASSPNDPDGRLNGLRHVLNWHIKALQVLGRESSEDILHTQVVSISRADRARFSERIEELLRELQKSVAQTRPEEVICLNIDWFSL